MIGGIHMNTKWRNNYLFNLPTKGHTYRIDLFGIYGVCSFKPFNKLFNPIIVINGIDRTYRGQKTLRAFSILRKHMCDEFGFVNNGLVVFQNENGYNKKYLSLSKDGRFLMISDARKFIIDYNKTMHRVLTDCCKEHLPCDVLLDSCDIIEKSPERATRYLMTYEEEEAEIEEYNKCEREKAVEMVSNMEHIIDNNYSCDSQIPNNITTDDIYDTAREIVYYS